MLRSPPSRRRGLKSSHSHQSAVCPCRLLRGGVDWNFCLCADSRCKYQHHVASFAEAWIEIPTPKALHIAFKSPPSRRRGLKFWYKYQKLCFCRRLLRGGVDWNFTFFQSIVPLYTVASFAEAWIEIMKELYVIDFPGGSPPSRRRGLKFFILITKK